MMAATTAALTALFGAFVFVAGQWVLKFIIEPIQEYEETVGEVSYALTWAS